MSRLLQALKNLESRPQAGCRAGPSWLIWPTSITLPRPIRQKHARRSPRSRQAHADRAACRPTIRWRISRRACRPFCWIGRKPRGCLSPKPHRWSPDPPACFPRSCRRRSRLSPPPPPPLAAASLEPESPPEPVPALRESTPCRRRATTPPAHAAGATVRRTLAEPQQRALPPARRPPEGRSRPGRRPLDPDHGHRLGKRNPRRDSARGGHPRRSRRAESWSSTPMWPAAHSPANSNCRTEPASPSWPVAKSLPRTRSTKRLSTTCRCCRSGKARLPDPAAVANRLASLVESLEQSRIDSCSSTAAAPANGPPPPWPGSATRLISSFAWAKPRPPGRVRAARLPRRRRPPARLHRLVLIVARLGRSVLANPAD